MFTSFSTCRGLEDIIMYLSAYAVVVTFAAAYFSGKSLGMRR